MLIVQQHFRFIARAGAEKGMLAGFADEGEECSITED
jgi:hypothetical protein